MQVQIPSRVLYINGFKGIRHYLDTKFNTQLEEELVTSTASQDTGTEYLNSYKSEYLMNM